MTGKMAGIIAGIIIGIIITILERKFKFDRNSILIGLIIGIILCLIASNNEITKLQKELEQYKFNEYVIEESMNDGEYENSIT